MTDPCWLPSAVMQTIGALYGIFIAVFILIVQFLSNEKKNISTERFKQNIVDVVKSFIVFFELLTVIVIITEIINGLILLGITSNYPQDPIYYLLLSLVFFVLTIAYISTFTYAMLRVFSQISNDSYDFKTEINFSDKIKKYIFNNCSFFELVVIISISAIFLSIYAIYNTGNSIFMYIWFLMLFLLSKYLCKNISICGKIHFIFYIILIFMIFLSIVFITSLVIPLLLFLIVLIIVFDIFPILIKKSSVDSEEYIGLIIKIFWVLILILYTNTNLQFLKDLNQIIK